MDESIRIQIQAALTEAERDLDRLALEASAAIRRWEDALRLVRDLRTLLLLARDASSD